jgi:hypothetical protein
MKQLNEINCETENCKNKAMGMLNGKWRCGECIIKYEKMLREKREEMFLTECQYT